MKDILNPWERRQTTQIGILIDAESASELERVAREQGIPKSRLIKRLIWGFLAEHAEQEESFDASDN